MGKGMLNRIASSWGWVGVRLRTVNNYHYNDLGEVGITSMHLNRVEHYTKYKYLPFKFDRSVLWTVKFMEYGTPQCVLLEDKVEDVNAIIDSLIYGYTL